MSNFRDVFCQVHRIMATSEGQIERCSLDTACATTENDHPRLWAALENHVAHRYERATGEKLPAAIDWEGIKQWLIDHWPQIVSMLISIIMLFLAF